jgi:fructose-1,6-bisphosphatase II
MVRDLAMDVVRVTEASALASARWMGLGNETAADQAAVDATCRALEGLNLAGTIVIGEGEQDEAPTLYVGEPVGSGSPPEVDVAIQPLDGGNIVARGRANAIGAIAVAERDSFLRVPAIYMDKIAVGPRAAGCIDITAPPEKNLQAVADALRCAVEDVTVAILDRPRHAELIRRVRETGARITLIMDGDVSAAIATALEGSGVDILMGIGGAREGIMAAAALRCLGGDMQARLRPGNEADAERARRAGLGDLTAVYTLGDLVRGKELVFAATGVTDGKLLRGVRFFGGGAATHSLVTASRSGTIRFIEATHRFDRRPVG